MANKLITVAKAGFIHRAYFFQQWLESEGINSIIIGEEITAPSDIELKVEETDVSRALEIIEKARSGYEKARKIKDLKAVSVKNILVPVDFSAASLNAAKYAVNVAGKKNASLTLLHVYPDSAINPLIYENFYSYPADLADARIEIAGNVRAKMGNFTNSLKEFMNIEGITDVKPKQNILAGEAEEIILSIIQNEPYDLIITNADVRMSSESLFGNFNEFLIEKSTIPVLTIPEEAAYRASDFRRLMYATDFDKSDGEAIRRLISIANPLESRIHVVHIDDTENNPFINFNLAHFKEKYLGEEVKVDMVFDLIVNDDIVAGIQNYISEKKIDVLAVTTHKRNLLTSLIHPSITRDLLNEIDIPMLVFHSVSVIPSVK